tara:strand:+ start:2404 stop:2649 length:246 start_codon:yes stop_codon:yes gene_type:complete
MNKAERYKEVENEIPDGITKGQLMKIIYSDMELCNIDASLPLSMVDIKDSFYKVMNYNDNIFGELQDMRDFWTVRVNMREL